MEEVNGSLKPLRRYERNSYVYRYMKPANTATKRNNLRCQILKISNEKSINSKNLKIYKIFYKANGMKFFIKLV
jgi:hypothetical protein